MDKVNIPMMMNHVVRNVSYVYYKYPYISWNYPFSLLNVFTLKLRIVFGVPTKKIPSQK